MIPPRKLQITRATTLVTSSAPGWCLEADAAAVQEVASQSLTPRADPLGANQLAASTNINGPILNLQITRRALVTNSAPGSRFEADSEPASEGVCATRLFARRYLTRGVHERRHSDTQAVAKK